MRYLLLALCTLSTIAHARQPYINTEDACLGLGKVAESTVEAREGGITEEVLHASIDEIHAEDIKRGPKTEHPARRAQHNVVSYVYTMKPEKSNARKIIYLKCKAGEYS